MTLTGPGRRAAFFLVLFTIAVLGVWRMARVAAQAPPQSFSGVLNIIWGDPEPGSGGGNVHFSLVQADGREYALQLGAQETAAYWYFMKPVTISGRLAPQTVQGGTIAVDTIAVDTIAAADARAATPNLVSGTRKVIYLLVKFPDVAPLPHGPQFYLNLTNPDTPPGGEVFTTTINAYYKKSSGNTFSWAADVGGVGGIGASGGWLTLPQPKSFYAPCDFSMTCASGKLSTLAIDATALGRAQGIDFKVYDNINFVLNSDLDCCAWGGGFFSAVDGKSYGATWEPPWGQETVTYAHEMGHSIGLPHSGWAYFSYDSPWDTMSGRINVNSALCGTYFSVNQNAMRNLFCPEPGNGYIAPARDFLGWIPAGNIVTVHPGGSATVDLEGSALPFGAAKKLIRICITGFPCTGAGGSTARFFTIEARVKNLGATSQYDNGLFGEGVAIHNVQMNRPAIGGGCFFNSQSGWAVPVDSTPGDYDSVACNAGGRVHPNYALFNSQWVPGQTYTNVAENFTVTVNSRTGSVFNVTVAAIVPPTTTLSFTPGGLNFGATKNGAGGAIINVTPSQEVTVAFTGDVPTWTATSSASWLQVTNGSGTGSKKFTTAIVNPGNVIGGSGSLSGSITISAPTAATVVIPVNLTVQQVPASSGSPFGQLDAPLQNQAGVQGALGVSGWVLDDVGVAHVKVYRNCLAPAEPAGNCIPGMLPSSPGTSLVFVGDAAFVAGARPDLESAFASTPQNYRAGFGYLMLTNMLPRTEGGFAINGGQGPLTLYVIATDVEGRTKLLGRDWTNPALVPTAITMSNDTIAKPFGALDFPLQGGTASGSVYGNFGWVLTPDANTIADGTDILMPVDGSTLYVYVDGALAGNVTYNQCRGNVGNPPAPGVYCNDDVASIFGNASVQPPLTPRASNPTRFRNLDAGRGPQGSFALNTTLLTNGLHSIAWSATDNNGRVEGIGSRNFIVLNGGAVTPLANAEATVDDLLVAPAVRRGSASALGRLTISRRSVAVRTGYDPKTVAREMRRDSNGVRSIAIPAMGRVEVSLAEPASSGYLVTNGELRDLPVGSRLDPSSGVFTWAPPVGYLGTYRLAFVVRGGQVLVDVTIY